ncbi:hypothetical protein MLD38_026719 [Melastoma candidum]|uniref:Uncharacterized protein n=1 Tax=Melastoma candidum TaxID=119954 RepID=A0ACB9NZA7_9MYRT|nr:hypothetical protein MLD38_026719 [Melastoma candidum]
MSEGQLEEVQSVVEGMKCKKVALDIFAYNLWISSYARAMNMDRDGKVLNEMTGIVMHYVLLFETGSRKRIIDQWKHSSTGTDIIACGARLSEALRDVGALDSSDHLHMLLIKKELHF